MKKNLLLTVVLAMFAWTGMIAGSGTVSDPYTCAEVIAIGNDVPVGTYVAGYIVGGRYDDFDYTSNEYGISIADLATETDVNNCVQVKLPSSLRPTWHPKNDPTLIGKMVLASGDGNGYGGYPALENNVTIEFYTPPVTGAPMIKDIMPASGTIVLVDEVFAVSATVITEDAAGIDSVVLAYGDATDALLDTVMMVATDSVYAVNMDIGDAGSKYGKVIAYGANGEMTVSSAIEVVAQDYNMFDMEKSYYQIIVDTVNARGLNTVTYNETVSENYYGAASNYSNFSVGSGKYSTDFATADEAIEAALSTVLLPAVRSMAAVNDTFEITYAMYGGDSNEGAMTFVCSSVAPLAFTKVMEEEYEPVFIEFTMDSVDYQLIVDYSNTMNLNTHNYPETSDNYYGASSYYKNFSVGEGNYDSLFVTADSAIEEALMVILLPNNYGMTAMAGDTIVVSYKMFGGDSNMGNMAFVCSAPYLFTKIIIEEDAPANESMIEMVKADYQTIVDSVNARGMNTHSYPDNSENYYGAAAYYVNFDARSGAFSSTFSSTVAATEEALRTILLPTLRPDAAVSDTFTVTYATYDGTDNTTPSMEFVCTSTDPLTFEYTGELPASLQAAQVLEISLYPNPSTSSIQLTKSVDAISVINTSGRVLMTAQKVEANTSIDVSSLPSGVYFVKVSQEGASAITKLIKE